ncbi:MAG: ATP-binding protein [Marinagarivorans sp.]|nr:ATP-binding protein [Marinagarivorans sp.]
MNLTELNINELAESHEIECKLAGGQDGRGKLPDDFWATYSAFANTYGGFILLGIKEKSRGNFTAQGIPDADKVITDLFNNLNNRQKISCNLIAETDVEKCLTCTWSHRFIKVRVRRASRHEKPVHLNSSPFMGNTYRRLQEGDRLRR